MYGSQQPHNPPPFYPPASSGPSQPEWQVPPPTHHGPPWQPAEQPLPPPPPPPPSGSGASSYNPGTYGPMPSGDPNPQSGFSPTTDTSTWGVRYNQQHHHQHHQSLHGNQLPAPPLPPRPSSAFDPAQAPSPPQATPWAPPTSQPNQQYYPQNPAVNVPDPYHQPHQAQQPWQSFQDTGFPDNQHIPPAPPPIPPAYQAEQHQNPAGWAPQLNYSDQPPTHHYDPSPQHHQTIPPSQFNAAGTAPSLHDYTQTPPPLAPPPPADQSHSSVPSPYVSPPAPAPAVPAVPANPQPPTLATGASALGTGGPSDWEHFTAAPDEFDDTEAFNFKPEVPAKHTDTFELPSLPSPTTSPPQHDPVTPPQSQPKIETPTTATQPPPAPTVDAPVPERQQAPSPPQPERADSIAISDVSAEESTIIDGVIQAWSHPVSSEIPRPLNTSSKDSTPKPSSPCPEQPRVSTPPAPSQTPRHESPRSITPKAEQPAPKPIIKVVDPNEDLDPWYKSSLSRYVTMLRKEMAAGSDEERFKIFTHFLTKESKLREILYGIEEADLKPANLAIRRQSGPVPEIQTAIMESVSQDGDDVLTYSPGGRPILASALSAQKQLQKRFAGDGLHRSASNPTPPLQTRFQQSSLNEPFSAVSTASPMSSFPRSTSVPLGTSPVFPRSQSAVPFSSGPTRPVYTPFRYAEGPQRGSEQLTFDRPAYQAYSALRLASVESGRTLAQPTVAPPMGASSLHVPSTGKGEHDETFIGLIREKSVAYRGKRNRSDSLGKVLLNQSLAGNSLALFDELRALIPKMLPDPARNPQIIGYQKELEAIPDNFHFIQEYTEKWDEEIRKQRPALDNQRRARQEESEHHIDSLFNDKEIGYSDINVLEDEFRQTEAQRQLTEERKEFESYVTSVFNPIESRLKDEISQLQAQYDRAIDLLNSEAAASDLLPGSSKMSKMDKYQLSHTMKNAVEVFQKLERRHDKQSEAVLERERRRKKAERRYWIFLGESASLKQLDKDFDIMEKRNILDAAKERDSRANFLMDSFDDASMRGLGENQSLLDDIAAKAKKIDGRFINSLGKVPPETEQLMNNVSGFVKYLGTDSESILLSFGIADRFLNDSDYEVSVSEARVASAGPEIFHRLEEEKKKEDVKIRDDLQMRLDSVKTGHEAIMANIRETLAMMRKAGFGTPTLNGGGLSSPPPLASIVETPPPVPPKTPPGVPDAEDEQKQRLRKALEDAKRRNAAKGIPG
ncbi:hypothetical protein FQN55_008685 [Onygenales sp. PD_40]|nr:hypothetical protein FQN55_008685 [Onygenales sp. PD_40]